ncbi:MAG: ABC-type phosphate/phosphonate transport system substrate-binding protein [Polyangiales bacterium]|jgi:ABC-type phosphate/phosphonate transport system substrate-binding protein
MAIKVMLLGRTNIVLDTVQDQLSVDVELFSGTNVKDVRARMASDAIDVIIMGAGLPLEDRLKIVEAVFELSKSTTVHMKDWDSGPKGMLPFVNGILTGIAS